MSIIEEIARSRKFYPVCKEIAHRTWMAEELHQEFLLRICEVGEQKFIEIKNSSDDYTDWYCMEIISNLWNNRGRVKKYSVGSTNPLYEITAGSTEVEYIKIKHEDPDDENEETVVVRDLEIEYDFKIDFSYNEIKDILNKDINSDDKDLNYQARAFAYSNGFDIVKEGVVEGGPCKNARQFANVAKIPYKSVWAATSSYLKKLKMKVND